MVFYSHFVGAYSIYPGNRHGRWSRNDIKYCRGGFLTRPSAKPQKNAVILSGTAAGGVAEESVLRTWGIRILRLRACAQIKV